MAIVQIVWHARNVLSRLLAGLNEPLLSLLEVDDVPDRVKVLQYAVQ